MRSYSENTALWGTYSPRVLHHPRPDSGRDFASWPAKVRLPRGRSGTVLGAAQASLVTLLAWVALLCAGLGGTVGVVSQTLAGKLAAGMQHLHRQAGATQASRALRGEAASASAEQTHAQASATVVAGAGDLFVTAGPATPPPVQHFISLWLRIDCEPVFGARHLTPPGRGPPRTA